MIHLTLINVTARFLDLLQAHPALLILVIICLFAASLFVIWLACRYE